MDMKPWMERVSGGDSVNAVAKRIDVVQSTLDGQLRSVTGLKPATAVRIARAYGADPVGALVELGLITPEEAGAPRDIDDALVALALREASDEDILREIGRRLSERETIETGETPGD